MIGRSSLPGVTQLGILVGTGVLLAAVVMLSLFLKPLGNPMTTGRASAPRVFRLGGSAAWALTAAMVVLSTGVLVVSKPRVETATDNLGPKNSEARAALREIEREVGGFDDALWLIVTGSDESEVAKRLKSANEDLQRGRDEGVLDVVATPVELWPNVNAQSENLRTVGRLVDHWPAARQGALDAGFDSSALDLSEEVFEAWRRFAATEGTVWPVTDGGRWLMSRFAAREDGRLVALGRVAASSDAEHQQIEDLAATMRIEDGVELVGWSLLSNSLLEIMRRDISRVLVPMTVILLVMLGLAFRRPQEVVLSVASLALALAGLLAVMSLLGWPWNLMNVMALPLLFGAGVDYAIHIQHALRRYGGDVVRVRNTVGRAILLCAASTAAGFGTLGMGSNAGIATLGRVCAVGVVSAALVSVFLLPQWWRSVAGDRRSPLE
jgi:predicted RND superfamily exporter protein